LLDFAELAAGRAAAAVIIVPSRFSGRFAFAIAMSALPPKADMCSAPAHVCFGPTADINHFSERGGMSD